MKCLVNRCIACTQCFCSSSSSHLILIRCQSNASCPSGDALLADAVCVLQPRNLERRKTVPPCSAWFNSKEAGKRRQQWQQQHIVLKCECQMPAGQVESVGPVIEFQALACFSNLLFLSFLYIYSIFVILLIFRVSMIFSDGRTLQFRSAARAPPSSPPRRDHRCTGGAG